MEYPKSYIVWDLETTGFDPKNCKILEIGVMRVIDGEVTESKNWILNHNIEIPPEITQINNITKEIVESEGVDPKIAMTEFLENFVATSEYNVTHNGYRFDIPFLVASMTDEEKEKYTEILTKGCLDTAVLYKAMKLSDKRKEGEKFTDFAGRIMSIIKKGVKYNVSICCEELGIDKSNVQLHRSLGDVYLTNEIYKLVTKEKVEEQQL